MDAGWDNHYIGMGRDVLTKEILFGKDSNIPVWKGGSCSWRVGHLL